MDSVEKLELPAGGHFVVAPEPRLRLVRRMPLWSAGRRWFWGVIVVSLFTWPVAFPRLDGYHPGYLVLSALGWIVWPLDLSRFFTSHARRTGFRPVRRELWIQPDTDDRYRIVIDGEDLGDARQCEIRVFESLEKTAKSSRSVGLAHVFTLAILIGGHGYELLHERSRGSIDPMVGGLARAIPPPVSVKTKDVGRVEVEHEAIPSLLILFVPLLAIGFGGEFFHVPAGDPRYFRIGIATLGARASVGLLRLTQATDAQGKLFRLRFGAVPALPPFPLSAGMGLWLCVAAHALLVLAVATLAWGP